MEVFLAMLCVVSLIGVMAYILDLYADVGARSADPLDPWSK